MIVVVVIMRVTLKVLESVCRFEPDSACLRVQVLNLEQHHFLLALSLCSQLLHLYVNHAIHHLKH